MTDQTDRFRRAVRELHRQDTARGRIWGDVQLMLGKRVRAWVTIKKWVVPAGVFRA